MQCEHDFVLQEERTAPNARHVRAWYAAALVGYFDDHVLVILAVGNDDLVMTKCVVSSEKRCQGEIRSATLQGGSSLSTPWCSHLSNEA